MIALTLAGVALGSAYLLWGMFLAVMSLQRARDAGTLSKPAYWLGLPILYMGLTIDFLVNVVVATPLFLELPREWTVSARVSRHCGQDSWRGVIACWICDNLLNTFDPSGRHCK